MATLQNLLRIDIQVRLSELRIAFSIADLAFEGDLPASIFHLQLIANDIADWKVKAQVIRGLSHQCRSRDFARRSLQRRTKGGDRQSVQATPL
jgi:hypothetical protein